MTQTDRVLKLLRQRGEEGLNTVDLMAPAVDGGKPILRLAARIFDLQQQGYRIRSERRINSTHSYFLVDEPVSAVQEPVGDPSGALFDSSGLVARGDYRDAERAA